MMQNNLYILFVCFLFIFNIRADTPANCMYEDVRGKWTFHLGEGGHDNKIKCNKTVDVKNTFRVELNYPNIVVDEFGNKGTWTMIYNQGFEVIVHGRKFFAFSKYEGKKSICNGTLVGWSHDVFGRDWSCYYGIKEKMNSGKLLFNSGDIELGIVEESPAASITNDNSYYKHDERLIRKINADTNILWYAKKYEMFELMTNREMKRIRGGKSFKLPTPAAATEDEKRLADELPDEFDWRNREGKNYVTPVRDQQGCGSCYSFASAAMNEARLKIATDNKVDVVLSPQDVLDCSPYSQDCQGGFPYLIGGKYSEDFGMIEESCNRYVAYPRDCDVKARENCSKHYFTNYEYIGGFYGGCNEERMRIALVNNGPIAVGFQVHEDFPNYGGGIYHYTGLQDKFNPFFETNHAVTIVGYGVEKATNTRYWIVKNSWNAHWGENGYFRIRRGTNECGIESIAVQSFPIF